MAEMRFPNPVAALLRLPPAWSRLAMLALAAALAAALYAGLRPAMLTLEERLGALGWTLYADPAEDERRITLVIIDEASLAEVGPWPWPRETLARLVAAIDEAGAQLQLHDIVYSEPRPGDAALAAALTASPGAVLAQLPVLQSEQQVRSGGLTHPLAGLQCGAGLPQTDRYLAAGGAFSGVAKGHIAALVSSDGSVRQTPAAICVQGEAYPALALSAWLTAVQADNWSATLIDGGGLFAPDQYLRLVAYPDLEIPLDSEGNLRISYASDPSAFRAVRAVDILNGDFDPAWFDNTWVLIGGTAFSMGDVVPTPYAGVAPGVELQARILLSLLDGAIPYTPAAAGLVLGLLSIAAAAALFLLAASRSRWSAVGLAAAGVLLPVAMLALHIQLLQGQGVWLGWLFPALYSPLAAGMLLLLEYGRVRAERGRVFGNLNSYLPNEIAREIAYSLPSSRIDARRADMTLLCADLRNFSAFGESRPPEESAAVLHFFFTRATRIVEEFGGRVHEFKGDGLVAVWDTHSGSAAHRALQAARKMQEIEIAEMLPEDSPLGLEPLALGVGIEQGPVLIGSVGAAHRRGHVLLGDTVSIVFRIQELTADLAHPILVGGNAAKKLKGEKLQSQGHFLLGGLRTPHHLFAPPGAGERPEGRGLKLIHGGRS